MNIIHKLLACHHPRTTWPRGRFETSGEYLRCLDCGEALPYDTRRMCVRPTPKATHGRLQEAH